MQTTVAVPHLLGGHCASSAFRDLVAWHAACSPAPLPGEAFLFLLAGGLDFLYWRRPGHDPPLYLLGRTGPLEEQLAARLDVAFVPVRPASPAAAWAWLRATLAAGQPALVVSDVGELPYLNARTHFTGHRLLVVGIDDAAGTLLVLDNDRAEVQEIPQAAFAASWSSTAFPEPVAYRYYELGWPAQLPALGARVPAAVADTVRLLDGGGTPLIAAARLADAGALGLPGMAEFVADLPHWPAHFPGGALAQALRAVYLYVEKAGTGFGGFFRGIYGRGLQEAAGWVADPRLAATLQAAGTHYQELGAAWSRFAAACRAAAPAAALTPSATMASLAGPAAGLLAAERHGRDLLAAIVREAQDPDKVGP